MLFDSPEKWVRLSLVRHLRDLRQKYEGDPARLRLFDEAAARATMTDDDLISTAVELVESLGAVLLSPDSPLPGCSPHTLRSLVRHVRKEFAASELPSCNSN